MRGATASPPAFCSTRTAVKTQRTPPRRQAGRVEALPLVSTVQDAIIGGAVAAALGVAAWAGAKGDPETCALCAGTGGCGCFACSSSGVVNVVKEASTSDAAPPRPVRRDLLGRVPPPPGQCRVCGGTGLVLCSGCRGSGYRKL